MLYRFKFFKPARATRLSVALWSFVLLVPVWTTSVAARDVPFLSGHVVDEAQLLSDAIRSELETTLAQHETQTSNQIVVLIVPSLDGEVLEEFSLRAAETYKLGQTDKDNGVLLLIAKDDRKLRIEVGYGLEGALTDALSAQIMRNEIVPKFRDGDFDAGVVAGATAILQAIQGEYTASEGDAESGIGEVIGEWIGKIIAFLLLGGMALYGGAVGFTYFWIILQHTFFDKSWWWFIFVAPVLSFLLMVLFSILWNSEAGVVIGGIIFAIFLLFKIWLQTTQAGKKTRSRFKPGSSDWTDWVSSSSGSSSSDSYSSSSSSGDSYSGGGGSFGGGGASGSW